MQKIALKIAYIGWEYQGFASQDNTDKTIEVRSVVEVHLANAEVNGLNNYFPLNIISSWKSSSYATHTLHKVYRK